MRTKRKLFPRLMSVFTAFVLLLGMIPISALAAPASDIPATMLDNLPLEGLAYTGYNIQWLKDSGGIYQTGYYGGAVPSHVLSGIGYSGNLFGTCTVADASTPTGLAPDINKFKNYGLDCTSFASYYYFNFLRNIKGKNIDELWGYFRYDANNNLSPTGIYTARTVPNWYYGAEMAVAAGLGKKVGTTINDLANAVPGDLIIFKSVTSDTLVHVGVYIGYYNGTYFMAHVGNSRGPEIQSVGELRYDTGSKASQPYAIYHFDSAYIPEEKGFIAVNKTDTNGNKLAGATFLAVNQATGDEYVIGPTDEENGYAISKEIDFGTYTVTETVFPTGYGPAGPTSWTITLNENTPAGVATINAVNQKGGILYISKEVNTDNYMDKDGWQFQAVNNATGQVYGPFTTENDMGAYAELPVGTYTVTEINTGRKYWSYDTSEKQVTITSGGTAEVSFENEKGFEITFVKKSNTGDNAGHSFMAYQHSDWFGNGHEKTFGPFTTGTDGTVTATLPSGDYWVYEADPRDQYWVNDPSNLEPDDAPLGSNPTNSRYIISGPESSYTVTFENWQFGKVQVTKETNTGVDLDGWEFEVTRKPDVNAAGTVLLQSPNRTYTKANGGEAYLATYIIGPEICFAITVAGIY